jgi:hypothetical protein
MAWISVQLLRISAQAAEQATPPRAPSLLLGKWRSGSTTEAVFEWLADKSRSRVWWPRGSIVRGTGRSQKAVDWALLFLRSVEAVEISTDMRCGRYHRYRVVPGRKAQQLRRPNESD